MIDYRIKLFIHKRLFDDLMEADFSTEDIVNVLTYRKVSDDKANSISEITKDILRYYNAKLSFILGVNKSIYHTASQGYQHGRRTTVLEKDITDFVKSAVADLTTFNRQYYTESECEEVSSGPITDTPVKEVEEKLYETIIVRLDDEETECVLQVLSEEFLSVVVGSKDKLMEYHLSNLQHSYSTGLLSGDSVAQYLGLRTDENIYQINVAKVS